MTTIPFSYPAKWVIPDLYLYCEQFEDLNINNGGFFLPNILMNCLDCRKISLAICFVINLTRKSFAESDNLNHYVQDYCDLFNFL